MRSNLYLLSDEQWQQIEPYLPTNVLGKERADDRQRHRVENAFCRLKDFRRIATRYDPLARNFLASVCLVAAILWWI